MVRKLPLLSPPRVAYTERLPGKASTFTHSLSDAVASLKSFVAPNPASKPDTIEFIFYHSSLSTERENETPMRLKELDVSLDVTIPFVLALHAHSRSCLV